MISERSVERSFKNWLIAQGYPDERIISNWGDQNQNVEIGRAHV